MTLRMIFVWLLARFSDGIVAPLLGESAVQVGTLKRDILFQPGDRRTVTKTALKSVARITDRDKPQCLQLGTLKIAVGLCLALFPMPHNESRLPNQYWQTLQSYGIHTWIAWLLVAAGLFKDYAVLFDPRVITIYYSSVVGAAIVGWLGVITAMTALHYPGSVNPLQVVLLLGMTASSAINFWQRRSDILSLKAES